MLNTSWMTDKPPVWGFVHAFLRGPGNSKAFFTDYFLPEKHLSISPDAPTRDVCVFDVDRIRVSDLFFVEPSRCHIFFKCSKMIKQKLKKNKLRENPSSINPL